MTVWEALRLFSCALVFAVWAVVRSFGQPPTWVTAGFLFLASVAFAVAELERVRQRRRR